MGTVLRISALALLAATLGGPVKAAAPENAGVRAHRGSDPVVSKQADHGDSSEARKKTGGPMEVFADIERAWNAGNVDMILRHFGSQKVAISVEGTGPSGGTFSRNQSYYLLKDLFRYTITRKFEFTDYRKPDDEGGRSFAIAERHYQRRDDGRLFKDKVYVSLHAESDDGRERWVVDEIKSIR